MRAGSGAGKGTKAGVGEKGTKEGDKEKGSAKRSGKEEVPEEWDEVEVSSDEETTTTAKVKRVDEKNVTVEKIEDIVKKVVEAKGTAPDNGKDEKKVQKNVQEKKHEELKLDMRKSLLLQAISGLSVPSGDGAALGRC